MALKEIFGYIWRVGGMGFRRGIHIFVFSPCGTEEPRAAPKKKSPCGVGGAGGKRAKVWERKGDHK